VAVVDLFGTFDESSAVSGLVALRECLADEPVALVVDMTHVTVVGDQARGALRDLAASAARWPGARIALCGARPDVVAPLTAGGIELFESADGALAEMRRLPVPPRRSVQLTPDRYAPEQARAAVRDAAEQFGLVRIGQLAQVIVSELVTNSVVHARTPVEVTARCVDGALVMAVRDGDPRLLPPPGGGVAADGAGYGRGLLIVDSMADAWGCVPTGDGKVVWARLESG
jgi:anti-sigma regulatory factor (Ser/Thr protein kinase)/anti-anti-sigma regulatory factor